MLKCKEIKGTVENPDIDDAINNFFNNCTEETEILNLMYSTTAIPYKSNGSVVYKNVSSVLIFYSENDD